MDDNTTRIYCVNDGEYHDVPLGTSLKGFWDAHPSGGEVPLAAIVDHQLKDLGFRLMYPHEVEFIGYGAPGGKQAYIHSLCFVLQHAVRALFPDRVLIVDHSLPNGLYCEVTQDRPDPEDGPRRVPCHLEDEDLEALRAKMEDTVRRDIPFVKRRMPAVEGEEIFISGKQPLKAELLRSIGRYTCNVWYMDGCADTFHGPLVPSTGVLKVFGLLRFGEGFCLQYPSDRDPGQVIPVLCQDKISSALRDYSDWCSSTGILGVATLNRAVSGGSSAQVINLAEALQERKYAEIADIIYSQRSRIRIVFLAGPSSSGKTSSALRLALQCRVLGLNPKVIELDNYFVEREDTPRDEDGQYDFEALGAMDLGLLNGQLNALLSGETVEIPRYDFKAGRKVYEGNMLSLGEKDILIMEGIHALDPAMVPSVDGSRIFRVYVSALTSLNLDENNVISTSDNRLLRRMVRDSRTRGIDPETTILRWPSVRRGEQRNIFPFQEHADVLFNSALIYELSLLRYYAEPLLRRISPASRAYSEAVRLLKFLGFIVPLQPAEIEAVPPTSIMREFIGGQTL